MSSPEELALEPIQTPDEPDPGLGTAAEQRRRREIGAKEGLRHRTARGTIVNGVFLIGLNGLGLLKGFMVAAFLTTTEYGVWGVLLVTVTGVLTLKQAGIGEKYVQQDELDERQAFQRAFTNELIVTGGAVAVLLALVPLLALAYGEPDMVVPGLVLTLVLPAVALQAPIWIFYRRMQFVRQRALLAIDPLVSFIVTVALAIAGFGYWSLVIGSVLGGWLTAIAALASTPLPPGIRFDRASLREYLIFSWPLILGALSALAIAQGSLLAGDLALGLGAAGAISLAAQISLYATKLDDVITQALYPGICAVKDRVEILRDSFLKSNRLAILWGVPFGVGVAIFTPDLISFGIGEEWREAETLIQVTALAAGANQIGFNWNAFFQAKGKTRPLAYGAVAFGAGMWLIAIPLLFVEGLTGFAIGLAAATALLIGTRVFFLRRLLGPLPILRNSLAGAMPTVPAAALVLALRSVSGDRAGVDALAELGLFAAVVVIATLVLERRLLRETLGYLRRPATA